MARRSVPLRDDSAAADAIMGRNLTSSVGFGCLAGYNLMRGNPDGGSMITLTPTAATKVKELLAEEGRDDIALRVAVSPGGCSGLRYAMYLDDQTSDKDSVGEQHGVRVVIDKMSVPYLSQATVDFVDSLEQTGFTIDNPAAQGGCACGNSFH
jgi:iron-sulfur cluster assembly accessory protein